MPRRRTAEIRQPDDRISAVKVDGRTICDPHRT
jgi:hypothetical protein